MWFCEKNTSQVVTKVEAIKKLEGSMQTFEANEKVMKHDNSKTSILEAWTQLKEVKLAYF
jgi:hypothetical protein